MHNIAHYELAMIIHDERIAQARRERLAVSARRQRPRRGAIMEQSPFPKFRVQEDTPARCVPCPSV